MSYQIRPNVIDRYREQAENSSSKQWKILAERDAEYRALNFQFQYAESDGSFSSSHAGRRDSAYDSRYKDISETFQAIYDNEISQKSDWRAQIGLTISEHLFLDNFFSSLLSELCQHSQFASSYRSQLIRLKAEIFFKKWKDEECIGGIQNRIAFEVSDFPYAAKRCRSFFEVGLFDFAAKSAIRHYRVDWLTELNGAFARQRLG